MTRRLVSVCAVLAALLLAPGVALAHPLGNFTINHYSGLRVEPERVLVDHVLDFAEIPAFQERQAMDRAGDRDGTVSDAEVAAYRVATCAAQVPSLQLSVVGSAVPLASGASALSFPPGQAGAPTLRLVCSYTATLPGPVAANSDVTFADGSYAGRIGWREITVEGDRTTIGREGMGAESGSARLTAYPEDLLAEPLRQTSVSFTVAPGGPALAPYTAPELVPAAGSGGAPSASAATPAPTTATGCSDVTAGLPGGTADLGRQVCELVQAPDLTPGAIIVSLLVAAFIGAAHAVSPGHGKTVMAAYLVGARGGLRHAVGLGLTVTISHTLGVLGLGALTVYASTILPPDKLQLFLGVASGLILVGLGLYLVVSRLRAARGAGPSPAIVARRSRSVPALARVGAVGGGAASLVAAGGPGIAGPTSDHGHDHAGEPDHAHGHDHAAEHPRPHGHDHATEHGRDHPHGRDHAADHPHGRHHAGEHGHPHAAEHDHGAEHPDPQGHHHAAEHPHPHALDDEVNDDDTAGGWHSHGVFRHTHLPEKLPDGGLSWRALFALGLSGGLVPSASAVIVLLVSISLGRPAYGVVLTIAFGLGMAVVLIGIGIALVYARGLLERIPRRAHLAGLMRYVPMATAVFVLVVGLAVTAQAFGQLR